METKIHGKEVQRFSEHMTSDMSDSPHAHLTAEARASLDRFAYIYIACEGAMIGLVVVFILIGYCVYKWRSRHGRFHPCPPEPVRCRPQLLSNATSTNMEDIDNQLSTLFVSESFPS